MFDIFTIITYIAYVLDATYTVAYAVMTPARYNSVFIH